MDTNKSPILAQALRRTSVAARALAARAAALRAFKLRALAPGQLLAVTILALSGVAAFGITPGTTLETTPTRIVTSTLVAPPLASVDSSDDRYWREERVRRGDTIGSLLARAGVDDPEAMAFLRTDRAARPLYQLRPGRALRVATDSDGNLIGLRFLAGGGEMLSVSRAGDAFAVKMQGEPPDVRVTLRSGEIESSLFAAADDAGMPDAITRALIDIFASNIDFYHDVHRGDRFAVVYETRYTDGEPIGTGRILAAEFDNHGIAYRAFLWRAPDGSDSYYTDDGHSLHRAFLRSPVAFSRITSGFTPSRYHPFLHKWLAHTGTDFAAPIGTPVHATADGEIVFVGKQTGYGDVVFIRHDATYTSVYAHLSHFETGLRAGEKVQQGDVIGFVGMTGWATGPHLHYEMRIAGVPRDPMKVALPAATPITPDETADFVADIASLVSELAVVDRMPVNEVVAAE